MNKFKEFIVNIVGFSALIGLPFFKEVYYKSLYYLVAVILFSIAIYRIIKDEKFEKKFYQRWHNARKQGYWINIAREVLRKFIFFTLMFTIYPFITIGITPVEVALYISSEGLFILFILLGLGVTGGIVTYIDNEKRYERIHEKYVE